ncbi:MAG: hypothetical protein FJ316_01850 [SAR202 cluster bacterium]|nr:hypothetical protein [SAR202 cluster bacterium]
MAHYSTFVVRILVNDEDFRILEGQITQASTHETIYFRDLGKAVDFICRHLSDRSDTGEFPASAINPQFSEGDPEDAGQG